VGLRLDISTFDACLADTDQAKGAYTDRAEAAALGFRGTPGFVLLLTERPEREAAVMIPGAVGYDIFEKHIERLLRVATR
jgi:predicted DsbA family dithiol-disulfide isomerase